MSRAYNSGARHVSGTAPTSARQVSVEVPDECQSLRPSWRSGEVQELPHVDTGSADAIRPNGVRLADTLLAGGWEAKLDAEGHQMPVRARCKTERVELWVPPCPL